MLEILRVRVLWRVAFHGVLGLVYASPTPPEMPLSMKLELSEYPALNALLFASFLSPLAPIRDQTRIHFHGMPPPDAPDPGPIASQGGWELGVNSLSTERQGTGSYFVVERHHKSLERLYGA